MTEQVVDVDRQQPQPYADLNDEQLMGLWRVAVSRTHEALTTYNSELTKLGEINLELKNRRRAS